MRNAFSRRQFLVSASAFGLAAAGDARADAPLNSLRPVPRGEGFVARSAPDADAIIKAQGLTGRLSYAVADATTGEWLECRNEFTGTQPASTAKAITALYALDALGEDHRFETRIMATGGVQDGIVQGDLLLVGGGDPTLDTDGLADMAAKLKAQGILGINGAFKVHEAALPLTPRIDPEQPDQVGYNPGLSGLALNFNRVHFEWRRRGSGSYAITMEGRSDGLRPAVNMAVMQVRDRKTPIYTYADRAGRDSWTVARGALGASGSRWLPVRKPGLYTAEVFDTLLVAQGLKLGKPQFIDALPDGAEVLVSRSSPPLRQILKDMLLYSTNLTAEMVGLAATIARVGPVADLRASAAQMNAWAEENLGMSKPALVDHSGLSDDSEMTAFDMACAMVKARGSGLRPILKGIGMRDGQGRTDPDHPIDVVAKTGTLNFVSGLVGYMRAPDGRLLAFAILAADPAIRATIAREDREGPPGAGAWNRKAKRVQQALIERWGALYEA